MKHVKRFALVFFNDELKPINERIVYAFVCAETGNADSAVGESQRFGGEQALRRRKDVDRVPSRCQQTCESFGRDCQSADVRCILFSEERNIHGRQIR